MNIYITGGSRGIGAAAVRRFAALGHRVTFFYHHSRREAEALAAETGAAARRCNVGDPTSVEAAFAALPPADVLILCAGISHYGLISQITEEQWNELFSVNVGGVYRCVRAALPGMLQRQAGCILTVSSMWGQVGASCEAAYSATKGAVIALTKALAMELAPSHIRVNCVSPGVIQTDMCACLGEEALEQLRRDTPLERLGTPEDVVQAMEYLVQASFVTGQILPVNGGFVL